MKAQFTNWSFKAVVLIAVALAVGLTSSRAQDTWTQKSDFGYNALNVPEPTARFSATGFSIGNKGYIGTGYDGSYKKDFWEYDPVANTWMQKAEFGGSGRSAATGFSIGSKGYIGTGFDGTTGTYKKDFWEYDPDANTWTQKADFGGTARSDATGFGIGSKGYIGTGYDVNDAHKRDFWEYDPNANTWMQKADFGGVARSEATGFSIGNKGYIGTGLYYDSLSFIYTSYNDFWEYDPDINAWTQKADFGGTKRAGASGFSIGNKGYIGTGFHIFIYYDYYSNYYYEYEYYKDFWEYDRNANTWTQKADFGGIARGNAIGFSIGSKGYLGTGSGIKDFWEYDPNANTWTQKIDFGGAARSGAIGFSIGTKGYIGTGLSSSFSLSTYYKDFWEYDPGANTWTQKADFGGGGRSSATGFSIGSKGYIGTGNYGSAYYKDFWEYDPDANIWTQKADFGGSGRTGATGFSIDGKGYIGTGKLYPIGYKKDFWEYDPGANSWTQRADFGGSERIDATGFSIGSKGYIGTGANGSYKKDFWEYNPNINDWKQRADFEGSERSAATGFSIGSKGYIGTGANTNDFWEYDPAANNWIQKANFGGSVISAATGFSIGSKGYIGTGFEGTTGTYKKDFWEYAPGCNGLTVYADADMDGYGDAANSYIATDCIVLTGYVTDSTDCDDNNTSIHPGACDGSNGADDNCNAVIDDGYGATIYYADSDDDGYGAGIINYLCSNPGAGFSPNSTDCNDASASINPGATEIINGIDDNCNGIIDDVVCSIPTNLYANVITATSATLKWGVFNVNIHYKVRYKIAGTPGWTTIHSIDNDKTLHELVASTEYAWQVKSICGVLPIIASAWSEKQFFTTDPLRLAGTNETMFEVFPNPVSQSATVSFSLNEASHTVIQIMDVNGRSLRLIANADFPEGNHEVTFYRESLIAGIYFLQLKTKEGVIMKKMELLH